MKKVMEFFNFLENKKNRFGLLLGRKLDKLISILEELKTYLFSVMLKKISVQLLRSTMGF